MGWRSDGVIVNGYSVFIISAKEPRTMSGSFEFFSILWLFSINSQGSVLDLKKRVARPNVGNNRRIRRSICLRWRKIVKIDPALLWNPVLLWVNLRLLAKGALVARVNRAYLNNDFT
jgi:hypothetical protein